MKAINKKFLSFVLFCSLVLGYSVLEIANNPDKNLQEITNSVLDEINYNKQTEKDQNVSDENPKTFLVTRVVDGDTIEVDFYGEKKKVRYIGIDTPEIEKANTPAECYGVEAKKRNNELMTGKYVELVKDVSETDKYGRLLRYVYVDGDFINLRLVEEGYADVFTYPPDVKYAELFKEAKRSAKNEGKGLWGRDCVK